jgi:hypothetical protein
MRRHHRTWAALQASLGAQQDEIDLAGTIADLATELKSASGGIIFAQAFGASPGADTMDKLDGIASRLLQATQAYRLARRIS